jgi:hypothetical protein
MKELLEKLVDGCRAVDKGLLYCADKSVHMYNWTTGGTKIDLANGLLTLYPFGTMFGIPVCDVFIGYALVDTFIAHNLQRTNIMTSRNQQEALQAHCKHPAFEAMLKMYKYGGAGLGVGSAINLAGHLCEESKETLIGIDTRICGVFCSLSTTSLAASMYVMRVEHDPPQRKNCMNRAYDFLKDAVTNAARRPVPVRIR